MAGSVDDLRQSAQGGGAGLDDLSPLAAQPIVWRGQHTVYAPSPVHVGIAASPPALYIRLVRTEEPGRRDRSDLVGRRLEHHLFCYAKAALGDHWEVRNLNNEAAAEGEVADIALWPQDRSLLVLIESKATLYLAQAQLGEEMSRSRMQDLYDKAFGQLGATMRSIGPQPLGVQAPSRHSNRTLAHDDPSVSEPWPNSTSWSSLREAIDHR